MIPKIGKENKRVLSHIMMSKAHESTSPALPIRQPTVEYSPSVF